MTVVAVDRDSVGLTLTIVSEFDAPVKRVWQVWADARQLERWWGPPNYPATIVDHDLTIGGRVTYYMTGPGGEKLHGWWRIISVDPPRSLDHDDHHAFRFRRGHGAAARNRQGRGDEAGGRTDRCHPSHHDRVLIASYTSTSAGGIETAPATRAA